MLKISLLIFLMSLTTFSFSDDRKGTVCLGKNLAKPLSEHSNRLYLTVNNSKKIYFLRPYRGPKMVFNNLDLSKVHTINIYFDDKITQSWKLNFSKLKTNSVLIWRAPGSWRMESNEASSCN